MKNNIDEHIDAWRKEIVTDLQALVRLESVAGAAAPGAPFGPGVRAALDFVLSRARAMGLVAKDVDGYAGHVEFGQGHEMVGILAHLDVVPAGEGWTHPPFGGEVVDGRLYGRGTVDDKGPVIACLYALAALREAGFRPVRRLRLILGCDEEGGSWESIKHYFSVEEKPLYGFSPDAEFPVINAEKGHLWFRVEKEWPKETRGNDPSILAAEGGTRPNVVPDRCRLVLAPGNRKEKFRRALQTADPNLIVMEAGENLQVEARGRAAHASLPEQGENAIGRLFTALAQVAEWLPAGQAEAVRFLAEASRHDGTGLGIDQRDEVSGALTVNLGTLAWDATRLVGELDLRYPVSLEGDQLVTALRERMATWNLKMEVKHHLPPLYLPADHPLVDKLLLVFREKTGREAKPLAIGGRTFACALGTGVAFGPVFPGRPELAHQADEYIDLEELILIAKIYAAAMVALAG
ncbi:MAG: dipeptidase PepV [Firmicutes bacterium]|nr:dipeptidase PepV [Bacillota bacterium]